MTRQAGARGRPIGLPEALRVLSSWEGKRVKVKVSNRAGRTLTWAKGLLTKHSTSSVIEFGVFEPESAAATAPVGLGEPEGCMLSDGSVRITTSGDRVVVFTYADQAATVERDATNGG